MNTANITIDGRRIKAIKGEILLYRALAEGFFIPNLCAMEEVHPPSASCRLCWVAVEGAAKPMTSCTVRIEDGMTVRTRGEAVDRLVRAGFEMLMSAHRLDCKICPGNRRCALQTIAKERGLSLRPKRFDKIEPEWPIDESRPEMGFNPNHCVLCGRCVYVCNHVVKRGVLDFTRRGLLTAVGTFDGEPLARQDCDGCLACVEVCPVVALYLRGQVADNH